MKPRDMRRSDWTRILKKDYISRKCVLDGTPARESLIVIREMAEPFVVRSPWGETTIADTGYSWLQIAQESARWWLTVMFDRAGELVEMYFDVTAGNSFDHPDNPTFRDMYLDIVVEAGGSIHLLDREELDEALAEGNITASEHTRALKDMDLLHRHLLAHRDEIVARCRQSYRELRALIPD